MAYNGGPLIGCYFKNQYNYYLGGGSAPTSYQNASTGGYNPQPAQWQYSDGATTPHNLLVSPVYTQNVWIAGGSVEFSPLGDSTIENNINALFVSIPSGRYSGGGGTFTFQKSASSSGTYSTFSRYQGGVGWSGVGGVSALCGQPITGLSQQLTNFLALGYDGTFFVAHAAIAGGAIQAGEYVRVGEAMAVWVEEIPYNQELTTYNRHRTSPSAIEIKTLDGAVRRYITGPATTTISATFKWSDNGNVAKNIDKIIEKARQDATPLVLYTPRNIYYNGPFIDLVIPTNEPTITMPAPGIYELHIEGTCQP